MLAYFKGRSFVSKLIKWRTWGRYSHVAWITSRGEIFESWHRKSDDAARTGVRKGVAGDLHKPGTVVDLYIVRIPDPQYRLGFKLLEELAASPDAKYGFRGVLAGFSLRKKSAHGNKTLFCSQLIMLFLERARVRFLINIEPFQTSPVDMSHSPEQRFVGTWETGTPFPKLNIPKGWH